jgi:four helix bundle protein
MAKGDDIEARLIEFAIGIVRLCDQIPRTPAGRHIAGQLLRSGTSPAPHSGEARGAESKADFIHKLGICLKELNESRVWLKIISGSGMLPETRLTDISRECDELCRIINASVRTARRHR